MTPTVLHLTRRMRSLLAGLADLEARGPELKHPMVGPSNEMHFDSRQCSALLAQTQNTHTHTHTRALKLGLGLGLGLPRFSAVDS